SLYISNNSQTAAVRGPNQMSGGLATSGAQTLTQLPGFGALIDPTPNGQNTDDFWFKDANTLYIADERNGTASGTQAHINATSVDGGVQKWIFDGTNWIFQYNVPLGGQAGPTTGGKVGAHGLAGTIDPLSGNAILFATTFDGTGANSTRLVKLVDDG